MKDEDVLSPDELAIIKEGRDLELPAKKLAGLSGDELAAAKRWNQARQKAIHQRSKRAMKATAKERRKRYWADAAKDLVSGGGNGGPSASCSFGSIKVSGGQVRSGLKAYPIARCTVDLVEGGKPSRMTATRIGAGALLAGPVGAVIGGMAKKDRSKTWVIVAHPGGAFQEEVSSKDKPKAVAFVRAFEAARS